MDRFLETDEFFSASIAKLICNFKRGGLFTYPRPIDWAETPRLWSVAAASCPAKAPVYGSTERGTGALKEGYG